MDAYIARQPILTKDMKIYGYELLFRSGAADKSFRGADADQATSRVVMESFFLMGVDSITGGKSAFINFTTRLIEENTATLFPKNQLVIEILEDVAPTPEIIKACSELHNQGYTLAMDDFSYRPELMQLIEISDILKIDFLHTPQEDIKKMLALPCVKGKRLLAEKIETYEDFDAAAGLGFTLFQGYFFSRPETITAKALTPLKMNYVALLKEISSDEYLDYAKLAAAIRSDVALSYKLLKLVNSAFFWLRTEVKEISQAITTIGAKEIRKWVLMIALMGISSDKPDELVKMSMIRGYFLENINSRSIKSFPNDAVFQTGLFSMLDVLMDMQMSSALVGMYLVDEVRAALIYRAGPLSCLLDLVVSLERSDWDRVDEVVRMLGADANLVSTVYLEAVKWCNDMQI